MNILFNASRCGLGNNGGSKTIIRCAETIGAEICANVNNYTWHTPTCMISKSEDVFPAHYNAIVAVSVWDIDNTIQAGNEKMFWYMRGWEQWVRGEDWLISQIKKFVAAGGRIIVNSSWLIDQLKEKCGVDSVLCWAGLDLEFWIDKNEKRRKMQTVIGSLGRSKHKTKRFDMCQGICLEFNDSSGYEWIDGDGSESKHYNREYCMERNQKNLLEKYNRCNIWFAPTELEGFHQCPAEANLCGCLVVCNRMPSNGMGDYATDDTAMRYDTWEELIECIENPDFSKVPQMQKVLREKIGDRETNMKKFIEILEG